MPKLHHIRLKTNYQFLIKGITYFANEREDVYTEHFIIKHLNKEIKVKKSDCEILHTKEIK